MAENPKLTYTPTCHISVPVSNDPCGPPPNHYWPDNEANREAGLATRLELTEAEAARFDPADLVKLGPATEGTEATEAKGQPGCDVPVGTGRRPRVDRGYQPVSAGPVGVAPEPPSGGSAIQPPASATK